MDPAQTQSDSSINNDAQSVTVTPVTTVSSGAGKEHEGAEVHSENIAVVSHEATLTPEVENAGVEVIKDTIELPPDVKKLGVTPTGSSAPVVTTTTLPQIVLPISDQQVEAGLHAQILSSLRWLAVWCIKQLKKAHIALRNIHGKIIRVKT